MSFPMNGRISQTKVELKFISTLNKEIITLVKYIGQLNFWLTYMSFSPKLSFSSRIGPALVMILTDSILYYLLAEILSPLSVISVSPRMLELNEVLDPCPFRLSRAGH